LQLKIDLHVHTHYSADSLITPDELAFYAKKRGLDGIAVVDHDTLDGALKIAEKTDFFVISGMEVTSKNGHIIALNIKEHIRKDLSVDETVDRIHEAGGIAIACHPVTFFKGSLGRHTSSRFDAVETINASAFPFGYSVRNTEKLATELKLPRVAGTDAHYGPQIGYAYTLVEAKLKTNSVINAIKKGLCQPFGRSIPWSLRLKKEYLMMRRLF
jgi:hypothetical protein